MSPQVRKLLQWAPRIAGIGVSLFAAVFALDAFDGRPLAEAIPGFVIHLAPAAVVGLVVAAGWRFPWLGAAGFGALAAAYAASVQTRLDWILVISGPLAATAVLFALSALFSERTAEVG